MNNFSIPIRNLKVTKGKLYALDTLITRNIASKDAFSNTATREVGLAHIHVLFYDSRKLKFSCLYAW